ncbi:MAG TPA: CBS domain-containing protein [Pseudogracilibacillus sp.]|nr:CBS domain-containing protein [Pseudogracilibacillus sp.]
MGHYVQTVMTEDVTTINPEDDIESAASILVRNKVKRLPVVDETGKLVGIVSRKDIMNHLFNN